ncbi:hypothetical protein [Lonepinella sp. BR2474]|uniref:hypothetical protein n=1 Tax=Lonepinella sp. BR2474 TaxID=3434548 RepID=UPI003F6E175C
MSVKTVAPNNMGDRLDWSDSGKQYNVNVADLIARIEALENAPINEPINLMELSYLEPNEEQVPNLNNIKGLGWKPFYGNIWVNSSTNKTGDTQNQNGSGVTITYPAWVVGSPVQEPFKVNSGDTVKCATTVTDYPDEQNYDFTGYQLATYVEVVQMFFHQSKAYIRTNDHGMKADGSLVNVNAWGDWYRV